VKRSGKEGAENVMSRKPANATLRPGNHPLLTIKAEGFMANQLDALLATFVRLRGSEPKDLVGFLRSLPEPGQLPSPWNTWTLIGLTRHRQRQHWGAEIVRNRLQGDLTNLAVMGALGHPESIRQNCPVPGMPDWEYFFYGRGCCFSYKVNGDSIDVDFWDDSADYFDTFFYENYLKSLRQPELTEEQDFFKKQYLSIRERIQQIVSRIAADLPEMTVHDIGHLDSLWETASSVAANK